MSLLSPERIEEAAPQVRTFLRKVATVDTEHWIREGLPRVNGLPPADVLARQVVALRDAVRGYLSGQEARYVQYVREHPPELRPVDEGALAALPPEAVLTYHLWLQDLIGATEETDKQTFTQLIRAHLREAIGTGGEAARRQSGALAPGFGTLTQKEAAALDRRAAPAPVWTDAGTQAFRRALADRAQHKAVQGAALRDGAGRVVAAATFSTRGETLTVRHLGALETVVPGAGLHMLRELAGLAASKGKGLTLTAPAESAPVLREIGLVENGDGRFTISAHSALALAQSAPGPSAAWTRAGWSEGPEATSVTKAEETPLPEWARGGWLEGPARTFAEVTGDTATAALEAELAATWPTATANFRLADDAIANFQLLAQKVAAGNITAEEAAAMHLYVLRGKDGYVDAVALVREVAGEALYGDHFGARVGRTGAGREMMRRLCGLESAKKHGFRLNSTSAAEGFYERLGMTQLRPAQGWTGAEYFFTPQQAQQFATGLTRGATFVGQITWELAVAGAAEYFENIIIPGVVDTVSATTHKQLVAALAEGLARGEGTNDLIARIRALDDTTFSMVRAERIARTEVITANRAGAYQIGLEAGGTQKRWVSRLMPNTRDWHREAHGQVVPYKQPFVVANGHGVPEHLMFPGDRSLGASADNTIQCVCSMLTLKPGVSDDATYEQYGAAGGPAGQGPVAAIAPEPVRKADVISLDDLRDFVAKDKGWVPGPNAGWKRRDEVEPERPEWKPVMSPEEARAWVKGSTIEDTVVHTTDRNAVEGIQGTGFDVARGVAPMHAQGSYFATDPRHALYYKTFGRETLSCKVRIEKPLEVTFPEGADDSGPFAELAKARERLLEAAGYDVTYRLHDDPVDLAIRETRGARMTELLRAKGYDSVVITDEGRWSRVPGGDQLIVFDREQAVVIDKGDEPLSVRIPEPSGLEGRGPVDLERELGAMEYAFTKRQGISKDKGWAPGPNAQWRRRDDEPEARVPEHLRDRVASSLNSMNLLIRPEWEAVMTDRGLSEDAIAETNRLLNAWGSNKAQQERAAAEILEHLAHKDEVARTIQAASQLEEDAWAIWTEAHPGASAFIYRKGSALTEDIEAWTRNYHGAWMGNAGHIGWDAQLPFALEAIHSKGYSILAGVNRGVGAPGEQEITLIRTELLYPGTDVRKDKGWAPGPNAGWKRRNDGPAAGKMPEIGEGFSAWRDRLWEGVKQGDYFKDEPALYRAMSTGEFDAAMEAGEFRPLMGHDLYVTEDPDRLAGGAYGGKDGGYIVQFSPDLETRTAGSRTVTALDETVVDRASVDNVVAVYRWDAEKKDHVRIPWPDQVQKDKGWMPGPNAQWRRLDDRPKGPDLPVCQPPNLKDFDAYATARGELLDYAVASEIEADENGASPTDWLRDGMQNLGEEWGKDFKVLVQERLYRRLEDDEAFRRMVADRMGLSPDQVGPESMKATVRDMVDTWAKTSGDSNVEALLIQEAARQEFGLTNARTKDLDLMAEASKGLPDSAVTWTPEKYQRYTATLESPEFDGYRSFVRAQYDETQDFLERAGIEEVLVYRGGGVPADTVPDFPEGDRYVAGYVHLRQNPLTSWSTDTATASDFQVAHLESQAPATFATVVPRGRILATPATGVGCLREAEVVVLGGETPAFMIAGPDSVWHNFDSEILMYDERTLGPHRFWPQTIPEGAGDDERK